MKDSLSLSKQLAFSALFAALCFVGTLLVSIPLPMGYFNVGDVFVLLAGWCLGPLYGGVAAGLGSALADVVSSYAFYAPFTFFIKGLDAVITYTVWLFLKKWIHLKGAEVVSRLLSAVAGEGIMVLGYFLTEGLLYGFPAATGTLVGNLLQGACCLVLACTILSLLHPIKSIRRLFPRLKEKE